MMKRLLSLLVLLLPVIAHAAAADVDAGSGSPARPRIGLVLSGGGARGAAHAGVLQVLEELRIPVYCVVGTSMGSVVGGLYASGMDPDEIVRTLRGAHWDDLLDDRPSRRRLPFRRKQESHEALFDFEVGLGSGGVLLPGGFIAGRKLSYLLGSLTLESAGVEDFDDLQVPFRAVATDLDTGERVILRSGSLGAAMRASMAVPGAFTPLEIDGRTLLDGMLVSNLPIDVARSLHADTIIAVDIAPQVHEQEGAAAVEYILSQSVSILMEENTRQQKLSLQEGDAIIVPDLGDMTPADFNQAGWAIDRGAAAARQMAGELSHLSVSETEYRTYLDHHRRRPDEPAQQEMIADVVVVGASRVDPRVITGAVQTRAGSPLDLRVLRYDLNRIYELGDFERVDFRLSDSIEGRRLTIDVAEKSWGPTYVRVGLAAQADFQGRNDFNAVASIIGTRVNSRGGEWRVDLSFGRDNEIAAELFQPLDYSGRLFVSSRLGFRQSLVDVYENMKFADEYELRTFEGALDVGIQFGNYGEVRSGLLLAARDANPDREVGSTDEQLGALTLSLAVDQLDDLDFPRSGLFVAASTASHREDLGSDTAYDTGEARAHVAVSLGEHTLSLIARGETGFGSSLPSYDRFELGGFLALSGYERGQLQGDHLLLGEVLYYYRIMRLPGPLGTGIYLGGSLETGGVWDARGDPSLEDLRGAGSIFVAADTVLGPISLAYGYADDGHTSAYLTVGVTFHRN
jgi:NTE family protein